MTVRQLRSITSEMTESTKATEIHYSVQQVAALWGLSDQEVHNVFAAEPGVLRIGSDQSSTERRRRVILRAPGSVLERFHRRLRAEQNSARILSIFRRHGPNCKRGQNQGRRYRACESPCWIEGTVGGRSVPRQSLKTRPWTEAEERRRKLESEEFGKRVSPISIEAATGAFYTDCERRQLASETLRKHDQLMRELQVFAAARGVRELRAVTSSRGSTSTNPAVHRR